MKRPINGGQVPLPDPLPDPINDEDRLVREDGKMPYGWLSPTYGSRGWAGIIIVGVTIGVGVGAAGGGWVAILFATLFMIVGTELLRTDAIQRHGEISLEYVKEAGILDLIDENPLITNADLRSRVGDQPRGHWFWGDDRR